MLIFMKVVAPISPSQPFPDHFTRLKSSFLFWYSCSWLAVGRVDNLLLTLSSNEVCSCRHGDSGGLRVLTRRPRRWGGRGEADRLFPSTPFHPGASVKSAWQLVVLLHAWMLVFVVCKQEQQLLLFGEFWADNGLCSCVWGFFFSAVKF